MTPPLIGPSLDPRAALQFIWEGQDGLADVTSNPKARRPLPILEALGRVPGAKFFAPVLRQGRATRSRRQDCAQEANVVWLDYDATDGPDFVERVLVPLGLRPSVLISSGRGYWLYLKLDRLIPLEEIESINRGLAAIAALEDPVNDEKGGDSGSPCSASTLARCPGSLNDKYHPPRLARVLSMDRNAIYSQEDLAGIREKDPKRNRPIRLRTSTASAPRPIGGAPTTWHVIDRPLSLEGKYEHLRRYIEAGESPDRSRTEMSIVCLMLRFGYSDKSIYSFFVEKRLAHFIEAYDSDAYFARTLAQAKRFLGKSDRETLENDTSLPSMSYHSAGTSSPKVASRAGSVDRLSLLLLIGGQTHGQLVHLVVERFGGHSKNAEKVIKQLRSTGAIYRRRTGKPAVYRYYVNTRKCAKLLSPWSLPKPRFLGRVWWDGEVDRLLYPNKHDGIRHRGRRAAS